MRPKKWPKILCGALGLVMATSLVGCNKKPIASTDATTTAKRLVQFRLGDYPRG